MNRILFCAALILAFAFVQVAPLHGHIHQLLDSHPTTHGHDVLHVHGHTLGADIENAHEHSETVEVDLLGTAIARDTSPNTVFALTAMFWAFILVALWTCIRRQLPPAPPTPTGSPPLLRPSPRAPPL